MYNSYKNNFLLLRIFASIQVLLGHTIVHLKISNELIITLKKIFDYMPGVPIFFLISGYLIPLSFEKSSSLSYFKNRFLRIYPALYFNILLGVVILYIFNELTNISLKDFLIWIFAQLTVFQFYNLNDFRSFGVGVLNGVLWTISVEVCFYILVPLLMIFFKRYFTIKIFTLFFLSLFLYYFLSKNYIDTQSNVYKLIKVSILPYLWYFLIGWFLYKKQNFLYKYIYDKVFIFLAIYVLVNLFDYDNILYSMIEKLIFCCFIFSIAFSFRTLSDKIFRDIDFTYGIYIYHMLVINIIIELKYKNNDLVLLLIVFGVTIICALLSFKLIEKPFLQLKHKI